jgi:ubiquitin C-terminal hydrolase
MINHKNGSNNCNLSVKEIKMEMGKIDDRYNYNRQEDANEFISNFLDALYKETSQNKYTIENFYYKDSLEKEAFDKFKIKFYDRKGYSKLNDLFYGIYITEKYCGCRKISVKFNAFNMIELPIYKFNNDKGDYATLDIKEILDSHFSKSKIYDSICENCHKDVYIKTSINKLPENLIIFFGRTANGKYIPNRIEYQHMDLTNYLHKNCKKIIISFQELYIISLLVKKLAIILLLVNVMENGFILMILLYRKLMLLIQMKLFYFMIMVFKLYVNNIKFYNNFIIMLY